MVKRAYEIGRYVLEDVLGNQRAAYGQRVVERIAAHKDLAISRSSLFNCIALAHAYPEIGAGGIPERLRSLSLSHLYILSRVDDPEDRKWFEHRASKNRWAVRRLEEYCARLSYERPHLDAGSVEDVEEEQETARRRLRLHLGPQPTHDLLEQLHAIGPASFRVSPSRQELRGWSAILLDCGFGHVRLDDLCLLRAFSEIAASRGTTEIDIQQDGEVLVARASGLELRIACRDMSGGEQRRA
jgi:hypothetical protein